MKRKAFSFVVGLSIDIIEIGKMSPAEQKSVIVFQCIDTAIDIFDCIQAYREVKEVDKTIAMNIADEAETYRCQLELRRVALREQLACDVDGIKEQADYQRQKNLDIRSRLKEQAEMLKLIIDYVEKMRTELSTTEQLYRLNRVRICEMEELLRKAMAEYVRLSDKWQKGGTESEA